MSQAKPSTSGLARGHRIPNFAVPTLRDELLLFYEFADGRPMVLAAAALAWSEEELISFVRQVQQAAKQLSLQSVIVLPRPVDGLVNEPSSTIAHDPEQKLHRALLAPHDPDREATIHVADPNLRIIQSAAIEEAALQGEGLREGMTALLEDCLQQLEAERRSTPAVAPVLVVPRVLGPELCRGLVDSFEAWRPVDSPMPTGDGALAVDRARKSRRDVFIQDERLEQELARVIAQRVLPELRKAFQYEATRLERLKLVSYPAEDAGHFGTHRDNTAPATAHRRFALTLNLNAGDYEGGALEFPEYGADCAYDVPAGTALLFSGTHAHRVRPVTQGTRYALVSFAFGDTERDSPPS